MQMRLLWCLKTACKSVVLIGIWFMFSGFVYVKINDVELKIKLEQNSSAMAFYDLVKSGDEKIIMSDYGGFEKVGKLSQKLPVNDKFFKAKALDVILYNANYLVIYYDDNSWSFTKLGKIINISEDELKKLLGKGEINARFYVKEDK